MALTRPTFSNRLQTRLTLRYAALFAIALLLVWIAAFGAVTSVAKGTVRADLAANGKVFERLQTQRANQLRDGAELLSREFGFVQACTSSKHLGQMRPILR